MLGVFKKVFLNEKRIIGIVLISYIFAIIGMYYGVQSYIESKDLRLFREINDDLDLIFSQQKAFVDIEYSNNWPEFKEAAIPSSPQKVFNLFKKKSLTDSEKQELETWKENFGDLASFYVLNNKEGRDGWNMVLLMRDDNGVSISHIFPYAIGFKKHDEFPQSKSSKAERPSSTYVEDCLRDALEFETTDTKSSYFKYFKEGSFSKIWSDIEKAGNEYYYVKEDAYPRLKRDGESLLSIIGLENWQNLKYTLSVTSGYVFNYFWKVFEATSYPTTFSVSERFPGQISKDRDRLRIIWGTVLTILMLGAIIPLFVIMRKREIEKNESLYDRLLRLCNPANFIDGDNYDKAIVDKANEIYRRLNSISESDVDSILAIQTEAVSELGINLINKERIKDLKELANPRNYLNPYNPDKVALANELFAILSKNSITYEELADVEERIKALR